MVSVSNTATFSMKITLPTSLCVFLCFVWFVFGFVLLFFVGFLCVCVVLFVFVGLVVRVYGSF